MILCDIFQIWMALNDLHLVSIENELWDSCKVFRSEDDNLLILVNLNMGIFEEVVQIVQPIKLETGKYINHVKV